MESATPDPVQILSESDQQAHLPHIYYNAGFLTSCDLPHINFMTGTTHTSRHPYQAKFDTDGVSISIYNQSFITK